MNEKNTKELKRATALRENLLRRKAKQKNSSIEGNENNEKDNPNPNSSDYK